MFKDNLIQLRKYKRLTQEDLAERLGVTRQAIAKWEVGETVPDLDKCKKLAEIFEVSLDDLANYLKQEKGLEVLLTGYCDNVGTEAYNMGLSRQRAVEIKKALMRRGIDEHRIEVIARGEDNPVGDNNTLSGRSANNRVTVTIQ